jgi:glycosyltransferase involved in cell wall biosynthesis
VTETGGPLAYLTASRIPGIAANAMQAIKMAEALTISGFDVRMAAIHGPGDTAPEALKRLYGVNRLPALSLHTADGVLGIHRYAVRIAAEARRARARLVFSRTLGAAAVAAWIGLPTVFECHGLFQGRERHLWRGLLRAPRFIRLVTISEALRHLILDEYPEAARIDTVVAHDGVDVARFTTLPGLEAAKRRAGFDTGRPVAGYAGHLYAGRGIDLILDVASQLPGWNFLIVGGTPADVGETRARIAGRGLENIRLTGFIDNADIPDTLAACDALLMPYQRRVFVSGGKLDTASWMSPLKMFEYLAMGRAIVASDLPVLREVLDERCARLLPPDKAAAWVSALRSLENLEVRRTMGAAARVRAADYDWRQRVRRIFDGL